MDFSLNLKAFLRQLPLKQMSGQQKFLSVAALLCKGSVKTEMSTKAIQSNWGVTLLRTKYYSTFYDRAQAAGWVNPLTKGKGKFLVTQEGLGKLSEMMLDLDIGENKKSGSLYIFKKKATHTFDKFLRNVFAASKKQVLIVDSYVDEKIFDNILDMIPKNNLIKLIYAKSSGVFDTRVIRFNQEYQRFYFKMNKSIHDRFIIVDDSAYILGPSIKDAASNSPAIVVAFAAKEKNLLQAFFEELWSNRK